MKIKKVCIFIALLSATYLSACGGGGGSAAKGPTFNVTVTGN
jgi:hypothetical protein